MFRIRVPGRQCEVIAHRLGRLGVDRREGVSSCLFTCHDWLRAFADAVASASKPPRPRRPPGWQGIAGDSHEGPLVGFLLLWNTFVVPCTSNRRYTRRKPFFLPTPAGEEDRRNDWESMDARRRVPILEIVPGVICRAQDRTRKL